MIEHQLIVNTMARQLNTGSTPEPVEKQQEERVSFKLEEKMYKRWW